MITFSKTHLDHIDTQLAMLDKGRKQFEGDPRLWEIDYNEALIYLSVGRFKEGWQKFHTRFQLPNAKFSYKHFPVDRWSGESLAGKNVCVWLEQGLGDQIMGASMLNELLATVGSGSVTLLCDRALAKFFRKNFPGIAVHRTGDYMPPRLEAWDFDCQLSLADLGMLFRNKWSDFPGKPFLKANPAKVAEFKAKYRTGKPLVGIAWSSVSKTTGPEKSMDLTDLAPILKRDDRTYIDLQYGDHIPELKAAWDSGLNIVHDPAVDQLIDMEDFFAQVAAMDMVLTTSQTLAHVAGSLGVPTHVMLPMGKGRLWYWFAEITHSPWYESVSLSRQIRPGDWTRPLSAGARFIEERAITREMALCLTA